MEIAGNEGLDYCISAGHSLIIEPEWDGQRPLKIMLEKMDWENGSNRDSSLLPSSCVDDADLMSLL